MKIVSCAYLLYNATFRITSSALLFMQIPQVIRGLTLAATNLLVPFAYHITRNVYKTSRPTTTTSIIVSLTSFPQRINRVHLTVESLLRQTIRPEKIILWLSSTQFPHATELPRSLTRLTSRGLTIQFVDEDLRSYKKYYHLLKDYSGTFVTVDDDVFYHPKMLETLFDAHLKHPHAVIANRCVLIEPEMPYHQWRLASHCPQPSYNLLPTGCAGVLYPAGCLPELALRKDLFSSLCMDADDIWLNVSYYMNHVPVFKTDFDLYLLPVISNRNTHLHTLNVSEGSNNDRSIDSVRRYILENMATDPFDREQRLTPGSGALVHE